MRLCMERRPLYYECAFSPCKPTHEGSVLQRAGRWDGYRNRWEEGNILRAVAGLEANATLSRDGDLVASATLNRKCDS